MSFSPEIKAQALIACGRCCCICHKFCGVRIECHHITPEGQGGDNTLDNCIPLCFDCHAEVEHYNAQHPKGNKFTPNELRGHRDRWFARVEAAPALQASPEALNVDKKVFEGIRNILPSNGSVAFVRQFNFTGFSFDSARLEQLEDFGHWAALPDNEFLDADLESLRSRLRDTIESFLNIIYEKTTSLNKPGLIWVDPDWEITQPAIFFETVNTIHRLASQIGECYDSLIRTCRRKLNVP